VLRGILLWLRRLNVGLRAEALPHSHEQPVDGLSRLEYGRDATDSDLWAAELIRANACHCGIRDFPNNDSERLKKLDVECRNSLKAFV
jgi:hypothetical protein